MAVSSPVGTGGAGQHFESRVVAYYLVAILDEGEVRGLRDVTATRVLLQRAFEGKHLDDLIVEGMTASGPATLSLQVKRTIHPGTSETFQTVMEQCWKTFSAHRFCRGRDRYGFAFETPMPTERAGQQVLRWASYSVDAIDFLKRLKTPKLASKGMRDFVKNVRSSLELATGGPVNDRTLWQFLKHLVMLRFDFREKEGSESQTQVIERLRNSLASDETHRAADLWSALIGEADSAKATAGSLNRLTVVQRLSSSFSLLEPKVSRRSRTIPQNRGARGRVWPLLFAGVVVLVAGAWLYRVHVVHVQSEVKKREEQCLDYLQSKGGTYTRHGRVSAESLEQMRRCVHKIQRLAPVSESHLFLDCRYRMERALKMKFNSEPRDEALRRALGSCQSAAKQHPESARLHDEVGAAQLFLMAYKRAEASFRRAIDQYEGNPDAGGVKPAVLYVHLAQAIDRQDKNRTAEALRNLERALKLDPEFARAWFKKGHLLFKEDEFEAAVKSFEHAIRYDKTGTGYRLWLGKALEKMERLSDALASYEAEIELNPESKETRARLETVRQVLEALGGH